VASWRIARPVVHVRDAFRHWRYLIGDSGFIFGQRLLVTVVMQGDYIILGTMYGATIVGPYFFAYGVATQAIRLTAGSLQLVLMAGLSRMPAFSSQQTQAALRATKAIALCGIPLCMLQAVLAGPLLRGLYGDKWIEAIPLIQLFSIGLAIDVVTWPACSLLEARGQFRFMFLWSCMTASFFVFFVLTGAYFGKALGAASAVCVLYALFSPPLAVWVFRMSKLSARDIAGIYLRPLLVGFISVAVTVIAIELLSLSAPIVQCGIAGCVGIVIGVFAARVLAAELCNDIFIKLLTIFPGLSVIKKLIHARSD
jgi:O-antigen/teichoic acid export membrane protein